MLYDVPVTTPIGSLRVPDKAAPHSTSLHGETAHLGCYVLVCSDAQRSPPNQPKTSLTRPQSSTQSPIYNTPQIAVTSRIVKPHNSFISVLGQQGRNVHWPRRCWLLVHTFEYMPDWTDRRTDRHQTDAERLPSWTWLV